MEQARMRYGLRTKTIDNKRELGKRNVVKFCIIW